MKYKIVIINYWSNGRYEPTIRITTSENMIIPFTMQKRLIRHWESKESWFALKLYGVHIFETDDLENFDLMEAQREKDNSENIKKISETASSWCKKQTDRKAKINNLTKRLYINGLSYRNNKAPSQLIKALKEAKYYVDNFDAEFERLEGER